MESEFSLTVAVAPVVDVFYAAPESQAVEVASSEGDSFVLPDAPEVDPIPEGCPAEEAPALPEGWSLEDGMFTAPSGFMLMDVGGYEASMSLAATQMGWSQLDAWYNTSGMGL